MVVVGVDPASNVAGVAVFDPETRELFVLETLTADRKLDVQRRIVQLHEQLATILMGLDPEEKTYAFIENTVMRGRSGQVLAWATGGLMAAIPTHCEFSPIQNTSVKKLVGGDGGADKVQVAQGCLKWAIGGPEETKAKVAAAIRAGQFDALDALAIGLAGYQREAQRG